MDPLSHKLAEFPFRVGDAQPLSGMLDQLKGARIVPGSERQPERDRLIEALTF